MSDLFTLLHGMLFTNIQLDGFQPTLSRLLERLQIEEVEEKDWITMAAVNIGSVFEYGHPMAVLRQISGIVPAIVPTVPPLPKSRVSPKKEERRDSDRMDVDAKEEDIKMLAADGVTSPTITKSDADLDGDLPVHLKLYPQLTFSMLSQALSRPMRSIPFQRDTLNPYIAIILTFASMVVKSDHWSIFKRAIPWGELASFLSSVPQSIIKLFDEMAGSREPSIITASCTPLPKDVCLRGMAWGGRKIYERGFWNRVANGRINEAAVLDVKEGEEVIDGIIEDDDDDDDGKGVSPHISDRDSRWIRVLRSGMRITKYVDGFICTQQPHALISFPSMTTLQPFTTARRESILALWVTICSAAPFLPGIPVSDLFTLLHGMLFTNIQLDEFQPTPSRLLERPQIEEVKEKNWMMIAAVDIRSASHLTSRPTILSRTQQYSPQRPLFSHRKDDSICSLQSHHHALCSHCLGAALPLARGSIIPHHSHQVKL